MNSSCSAGTMGTTGWNRQLSQALELGCFDVGAVRLLLGASNHGAQKTYEQVEIGALSCYDRPQPQIERV